MNTISMESPAVPMNRTRAHPLIARATGARLEERDDRRQAEGQNSPDRKKIAATARL